MPMASKYMSSLKIPTCNDITIRIMIRMWKALTTRLPCLLNNDYIGAESVRRLRRVEEWEVYLIMIHGSSFDRWRRLGSGVTWSIFQWGQEMVEIKQTVNSRYRTANIRTLQLYCRGKLRGTIKSRKIDDIFGPSIHFDSYSSPLPHLRFLHAPSTLNRSICTKDYAIKF